MSFHPVGQANLELLASGDPPALASQSAGIAGVNHCLTQFFDFNTLMPKTGSGLFQAGVSKEEHIVMGS